MADDTRPTLNRPNSITYIQIPAPDPLRSGEFYRAVFGWNIRGTEAHLGFDDASGFLSGALLRGLAASAAGILPYIYVDRIDETIANVTANGGEVVREPYPEGDLWVATFRDVAGNLMGVWQQGPR